MPRSEGPLRAVDDLLGAFARDLRELREKAGNPTYRELARRAHYSAGTLSDAAGGKKLPTLAVTLAFVRACEGDPVAWERRWRADAAEYAARRARLRTETTADDGESPYVGLAAFQAEDADRFFGREKLVDELRKLLTVDRFVPVFGASGVGKSSLLRAGLVPALADAPVAVMTPGAHPIEECAVALARVTGESAALIRDELLTDGLHLRVRQTVADGADLVLVIDQFEEVFTVCPDVDERTRFIDAILAAAEAPTSRIRLVIGVRSDFYPHCALHPGLADALRRGQLVVEAMSSDELQRAITQPAIDAGYTLERSLLATVIADSAGNPGVLPLVSHALLETWRRRHGTSLTLSGYQTAGGIQDALARTAEHVFLSLTSDQRDRARVLLVRLIAVGDGTEDTKRRVPLAEFDPADGPVLDRLVESRLLCLDRDSVEITHEALIRCWPRLREWLAADRDGLRLHRQLTHAADLWDSDGRDPSALYRGNRLAQLTDWAPGRALSARERDFLQASQTLHVDEQLIARRRTNRLRRLVAILVVLLVLATTAVGSAGYAQHEASQQRDQAVIQKVLSQANALRSTNPGLAAQLSLAAYRLAPDTDTRSSVLTALTTPYAVQVSAHTDLVHGMAISPNGRFLATVSNDKTGRIWDISDPTKPVPCGMPVKSSDRLLSVAFSPDGHTVAMAGMDSLVRMMSVDDRCHTTELATLSGTTDGVVAVGFSHDGSLLAAGSLDGMVRLWNVAAPGQPRPEPPIHLGDRVWSLAFDPTAHVLAAGVDRGNQAVTQLWNTDTRQPLGALPVASPGIYALAYSPDGHTVAEGDADGAIELWDVTDSDAPKALATLSGPAGGVRTVAFRPDGHTLVAGSEDNSVRLWNVTASTQPVAEPALTGFSGAVYSLAITPDGRTLVTGGQDGSVRLVRLAEHTFATRTDNIVASVTFSPDGRTLADTRRAEDSVELRDLRDPSNSWSAPMSASPGDTLAFAPSGHVLAAGDFDSLVKLWNVSDVRRPNTATALVPDAGGGAEALAFSPDGHTLAAGVYQVRLWDVSVAASPRVIGTLATRPDSVNAVAFDPTGHFLAVAGSDTTTSLWDVTTPASPRLVAVLGDLVPGSVRAIAFDPVGRLLALSSNDNTVQLWDVSDPRRPARMHTLSGHSSSVNTLAFSPDGRVLATGSSDNTVRLWDVSDPFQSTTTAILTGHTSSVNTLAFSPDGKTLATGSSDRSIGLWDTDVEHMAAHLCSLAWPRISEPEWNQYLRGFDYRPPCPA